MAEKICIMVIAIVGLLHTFWLYRLEIKYKEIQNDLYEEDE